MKKELNHFSIEHYYGGSQQWMLDPWMNLGGCAALAAVDSCIYFALEYRMKKLCPVDARKLTKTRYRMFASDMKPYLRPRAGGVNRLEMYTEGFGAYLKDHGFEDRIGMKPFSMGCPVEEAAEVIQKEIEAGFLIPMLHLENISWKARHYFWHWFLINGYEQREDGFYVKLVTYGAFEWMKLDNLWDTKRPDNGGLILYHISDIMKKEENL